LIVDCHAHIEDEAFGEGVAAVMERAREAGVEIVINPGYDVRSSLIAAENAATHRGLYAMAGIHPHDAAGVGDDELEEISKILSMPRVVGIGEIGLDYYRDFSPRDEQVRVFRAQLELAKASGCPVQIHSRDANLETFNILKEYAQDLPAIVLHCYSGSAEMAADLIKLGFFISLGGPVTYRNARKPVEVARDVPLDRLLVETDSPYLPPSPHRGERNEPAYVVEVVRKIADIKGVPVEEVAQATSMNAMEVFSISPEG
jgi:TatD DNase family protein